MKDKELLSLNPEIVDIDRINGIDIRLSTNSEQLAIASAFEQRVWNEEGYGSLEEYAGYIANSRTFTVFRDDECIGIARLFDGRRLILPFVTKMLFDSEDVREEIAELSLQGKVEEFGTVAVDRRYRNRMIFERLARLAYRDSYNRGIEKWGVIMEPERVNKMNHAYGFTFKRLGIAVDYQGGYCAAHIMDLQEVYDNMRVKFPEIYNWFANEELKIS